MLTPINDRVVVRRDTADNVTKGGIHIPETAKKNDACSGTVIAVGPGKLFDAYRSGNAYASDPNRTAALRAPMSVKPEDRVIFSAYAGVKINIDGEELLVMSEDDILAIKS
jgi:chaperonin GroES